MLPGFRIAVCRPCPMRCGRWRSFELRSLVRLPGGEKLAGMPLMRQPNGLVYPVGRFTCCCAGGVRVGAWFPILFRGDRMAAEVESDCR